MNNVIILRGCRNFSERAIINTRSYRKCFVLRPTAQTEFQELLHFNNYRCIEWNNRKHQFSQRKSHRESCFLNDLDIFTSCRNTNKTFFCECRNRSIKERLDAVREHVTQFCSFCALKITEILIESIKAGGSCSAGYAEKNTFGTL